MDSHPGLLRAEPTRRQVLSLTVPTALVRLSFNSVYCAQSAANRIAVLL